MQKFWKVLFWIVIVCLGLPIFGILSFMVLSTFTDIGSPGSGTHQEATATLDGQPSSVRPPTDLADALSFFSSLTDVKKNEIKDSYRGKLVQWTLPVWDVSKRDEKYVIQTSDDAPIAIFCHVVPDSKTVEARIRALNAGDSITCKGTVSGYTLGNVNIAPAMVLD